MPLEISSPVAFASNGVTIFICSTGDVGDSNRMVQAWSSVIGYSEVKPLQVWLKWTGMTFYPAPIPWLRES